MKTIYIDKENIGTWKAKRIAKKLYRISKKEDIVIALSKNLIKHEVLNYALNEYGLKVLNGRWIFRFLLFDILDYVSEMRNIKLETLSLAILMDKADEIIMQQLEQIAKNVKTLKIVTNSKNSYLYIEDELFNIEGIAIQITNNKEKSISNVDIILNFDFNEERLENFKINPDAVIINLGNRIKLNTDIFKGRIINDYEINYSEENFDAKIRKENFDKKILYESYIYRRDTFANIQNQLKIDNVKISKITWQTKNISVIYNY